jgi:hypothetical protein
MMVVLCYFVALPETPLRSSIKMKLRFAPLPLGVFA